MVDQNLIKHLEKVCESLEKSYGDLSIFAPVKMDELIDKWTIIVSANWVVEKGFEQTFDAVRTQLLENLEADEMSNISRIGVFKPDEHFATLILKQFTSGDTIKEDTPVNGNVLHEGYFLKAEKAAA